MLPAKFKLAIRKVKSKDGMIEDPGVRKQLDIIKALFDEATEIIVATDAGREGELIFRYIYYYLKCKKPFKRLWISSQTDAAIKEGFRNLKPGADYDTLFNSAHCRSQSDWLVGMNATQALSLSAGSRSVLSLGRVQTPTLAMICSRYNENKNFVPELFYQVSIMVDKEGQVFRAITEEKYKTKNYSKRKPVAQYNFEGNFIKQYTIVSRKLQNKIALKTRPSSMLQKDCTSIGTALCGGMRISVLNERSGNAFYTLRLTKMMGSPRAEQKVKTEKT
jgi:DNA topoisomerase IA